MTKHNQLLGKWGESTAADYLERKGYVILAKNIRTPYGEIDIVASLQNLLIFIEVKTRSSRSFGMPEESLTARKLARMRACAEHYAVTHDIDTWQCDAISIEGQPDLSPRIEHFENVTN